MGSGKGQSKRVNSKAKDNIALITIPDDLVRPEIELEGLNGNAFAVMGEVGRLLREAGNSKTIVDDYFKQATAGNYNHLLRVSMAFTESDWSISKEDIDEAQKELIKRLEEIRANRNPHVNF